MHLLLNTLYKTAEFMLQWKLLLLSILQIIRINLHKQEVKLVLKPKNLTSGIWNTDKFKTGLKP